jgi:DNA-binding phage protein
MSTNMMPELPGGVEVTDVTDSEDRVMTELDELMQRQHKEVKSYLRRLVQLQARGQGLRQIASATGCQKTCGHLEPSLAEEKEGGSPMVSPDHQISSATVATQRFRDAVTLPELTVTDNDSGKSEISMDEVIHTNHHRFVTGVVQRIRTAVLVPKGGQAWWQIELKRFTGSTGYEVANAILILINAVLIAWEAQDKALRVQRGDHSTPAHFDVFMYLFCAIYSLDLGLRIGSNGRFFLSSADWKWNCFDIFVVGGSWMEVVSFMLAKGEDTFLTNASILRIIRLVRVARIVKAMRSFVYFRDLRITVSMLCEALIPLTTHAVIMFTIFTVFGIFFTDGVSAHMIKHGLEPTLVQYYGTLFKTVSTLFKSIAGGVDWEAVLEPLEQLSGIYVMAFYFYVFFGAFALVNVISAIFIDNTIQRSKSDREFVVSGEISAKKEFLTTMEKLFEELDPDQSGTIAINELQRHIMDPKVNAYFRAIDLNVFKVKKLFQLMDSDSSGGIDRKEFSQGCTRLRGEAKELDVAILQYQVRQMHAQQESLKNLVIRLGDHLDNKFEETARSVQSRLS